MYEKLIGKFKKKIKKTEFSLFGRNFEEGRIREQKYFDLQLEMDGEEKRLMRISIYKGKEPYYKPWIEMFSIRNSLNFGEERFSYFDSKVEKELLDIFASHMDEGGRIFVEYQNDKISMRELSSGVPEPCSRLGYELFKRGFTWFKDWYFSEGFHEGNQKIQGEKPIDDEHKKKHLDQIKNQVEEFLEGEESQNEKTLKRAQKILEEIKN